LKCFENVSEDRRQNECDKVLVKEVMTGVGTNNSFKMSFTVVIDKVTHCFVNMTDCITTAVNITRYYLSGGSIL
jgi:hypothetical protein